MRIAAVTDDGRTISQHFGRARAYLVCTVERGVVVTEESRDKAGHHTLSAGGSDEHGHEAGGHGMGGEAASRHAAMVDAIRDCAVVLTRGMGRGAYVALQEAGIEPIVTSEEMIADAVRAYVAGTLVNHPERLH
jgi:predicted Fe-Mo cluster-binding NifX family protein